MVMHMRETYLFSLQKINWLCTVITLTPPLSVPTSPDWEICGPQSMQSLASQMSQIAVDPVISMGLFKDRKRVFKIK